MNSSASLTIDDYADFTWGFGCLFILEAGKKGDFVWSDPDYQGDNSIVPYDVKKFGPKADFASPGLMGRCKGTHRIGDYCGKDAKIIL